MEHVEETISVGLGVTIRLERTHSKIHLATWPGFWTKPLQKVHCGCCSIGHKVAKQQIEKSMSVTSHFFCLEEFGFWFGEQKT